MHRKHFFNKYWKILFSVRFLQSMSERFEHFRVDWHEPWLDIKNTVIVFGDERTFRTQISEIDKNGSDIEHVFFKSWIHWFDFEQVHVESKHSLHSLWFKNWQVVQRIPFGSFGGFTSFYTCAASVWDSFLKLLETS